MAREAAPLLAEAALENLLHCHRRYIAGSALARQAEVLVLAIGGDGGCRAVFSDPPFRCQSINLAAGDPDRLPMADASADIVVAAVALDHAAYAWRSIGELLRVVRPDGFIFLTLPAGGVIHRYPVDRYGFLADPCVALAAHAGCTLVEQWPGAGPWRDPVGVFRRADAPPLRHRPPGPMPKLPDWNDVPGTAEQEAVGGAVSYLSVLERLHAALAPAHYLEIGVRRGVSLALARGPATGVDPHPAIDTAQRPTTRVLALTSDSFFAQHVGGLRPELCFIDGMHWFEYALRDFMNFERCAAPGAVVVIDDIFPNHPRQAARQRATRTWTGDVWRLLPALHSWRPDLFLLPIDTSPTGLLLVAGLDPANRVLWDSYDAILREARAQPDVPPSVIQRQAAAAGGVERAVAPDSAVLEHAIDTLRTVRAAPCPPRQMVARLRGAVAEPAAPALRTGAAGPKLSLVVIGYNMARALPRTIRSLSPAMQRGIDPVDYEIIVIDNGSTRPAELAPWQNVFPNLRVHRMPHATVSPVPAINVGLSLARGDLVGVCIDGARMASPGLLAKALAASRLHERPVIGTVAFHLGPSVQAESIQRGYNEAVEDALLAGSGWETDGYRLFGIASFAVSSAGGWFTLPSESNAFFLRAGHWRALGGWDPGFTTPGGGFANADTWKRACDDPSAAVIMLMGEATFHQVHGGIATNNVAPPIALFQAEYRRLRGHDFAPPTREPLYFGSLPVAMRGTLRRPQARG